MYNCPLSPPLQYSDDPISFETNPFDSQDSHSEPAGSAPVFHHATMHTRESSTSSANSLTQYFNPYDHFGYGSRDTPSPYGSSVGLSRTGTIVSPTHSRYSASSQTSYSSNPPNCFNRSDYRTQEVAASRMMINSISDNMAVSDSSAPNTSIEQLPTRSMLADSELCSPELCSEQDDDQESTRRECSTTCVSSTERSKRSRAPPKFWCTACNRGFVNKSDWMAHEEEFQEWFDIYLCDRCDKFFFNKDKYARHHKNEHECPDCENGNYTHANAARRKRERRQAWGCGFCFQCDTDWKKRCAHIAFQHLTPSDPTLRRTKQDWKHSQVIRSLLSRPGVAQAWHNRINGADDAMFEWDKRKTGRAEGYPVRKCEPNLQDLLEWHPDGADPSEVVERAFRESNALHVVIPTSMQQPNWNPQGMNRPSPGGANTRTMQTRTQHYPHERTSGRYINYSRPLLIQAGLPQYGEPVSTAHPGSLSTPVPPTILENHAYLSTSNAVAYYNTYYSNGYAQL